MASFLASFINPQARGRFLVVSVVVLFALLYILRAFINARFGGSSAIDDIDQRSRAEISMLTFNIWCCSTEKAPTRARMEAFGQIVEDLQPDLITLQEVTFKVLAILQEQRWFSRYQLIPPDATKQAEQLEESEHIVIILSSYHVDKWIVHPFTETIEKRRLVIAEIKIPVSSSIVTFAFTGTHLAYASRNSRMREGQLKESLNVTSGYENVCVMGDMNIKDKFDGNVVLPSLWIDAWLSIPGNTDNSGYTWDCRKNPFISKTSQCQGRVDRVLCKLSDFKVKSMAIVGDRLTKGGIVPSDHYGVFTILGQVEKSDKHEHNKLTKALTDHSEVYFIRPPGQEKVN